jgi:protein-S-isoprenylcysteine O-methyltransferase Ste14
MGRNSCQYRATINRIRFGIVTATLLIISLYQLKDIFFASLTVKSGHQLITSGIYSYIRYPVYVLFFITWICYFLITANLLIGLTGILSYLINFLVRVPREEDMMEMAFHEEFRNYKRSTGRFFPMRIMVSNRVNDAENESYSS